MAKETYVSRCVNWEVNDNIAIYECFGWELVANNVVTSMNTTDNMKVAAENDLTFSRDKDAAWYPEVSRLQQEYVSYGNQIVQILETDPTKKIKFRWLLFILGLWCGFFFGIGTPIFRMIGLIYPICYIIMVVRQKNKEKEWHEVNDAKIADIEKKRVKIMEESSALVNGSK